MKTFLKIMVFLAIAGSSKAQVPNFTITNISGTYTLTCSQTQIVLTASTTVFGQVSFHWFGPSFNVTATSATFTQAGSYTVTALDSLNNPFGTQTFTIMSNTAAPASGISPVTQTISCLTPVGAAVTSSASGNVTHYFISPFGGTVVSNQSVASYTALGPGSYTHVLVNNVNGCQSFSTFTLTSPQGFPTFNVNSPQNYTLGCNSKSVVSVFITNGSTAPVAGGPVSYTFMPLSETNPAPSGVLSPASVFTVATPGLYYAIVKDNTSGCMTQIPVTIVSNTTAPNISATVPTQILDCNTSQVVLQGNTTTANTSLAWFYMGTPGAVAGSTILATTNIVAPTASLVNNYTLEVTDLNSTCKSFSVIPVFQNLFSPHAVISTGGNNAITCITPSVILTNQSTSGIPPSIGFPTSQPVIGYAWYGPALPSQTTSSTYTANAAGVYTLIAKDLNNGCTAATVITILDNRIYPAVGAPDPSLLPCPGTTTLAAVVISSPVGLIYSWTGPSGGIVGLSTLNTITAGAPGFYSVVVTNTVNGCSTYVTMAVYACVGLEDNSKALNNIRIFPNPNNGVFTVTSVDLKKNAVIEVYNSIGELVKKQAMDSDETIVNISGLAPGIYMLQVSQNNTVLYVSKLIRE